MNATQAIAKIKKLLGPKGEIHDSRKASSPEQREAAGKARREGKARKDAAEAAMNARAAAVLAADAEYQRLHADYIAERDALRKVDFGAHYRYSAGRNHSYCFSVESQADNLAELVAKLEEKVKS